ncbi:MAG: BamA/TamA family outer membrane protein [Deltaproteobacteria bacterium]|nr:BamA/TamA family outer membrane protein [Deltaproteobacteria bacterium]
MQRRLLPHTLLLLVFSALMTTPRSASALDLKKRYERELVHWGLQRAGLTIDPAPKGKAISRVVVLRQDIIAKSDPWPSLLNYLHVTTRDTVVRQEVLQRPGDVFAPSLAAETERNLRKLLILGVARVLPCRDANPSKVVLLVVTKDVWSLRLNMVYSQTGSMVHGLDFTPTEANFLGRNKQLSLHLALRQLDLSSFTLFDGITLGQRFIDQRLLGSRVRLYQAFDLYIDGNVPCGGWIGTSDVASTEGEWCPSGQNGELAGGFARLRLERPLFSLATRWGFFVDGWIDVNQRRRYLQDGSLATVSDERVDESQRHHLPLIYDSRRFVGSFGVTRSVGSGIKHDMTWGMLAYRLRFSAPAGVPYQGTNLSFFQSSVLPRSETAAAFYLRYSVRPWRYVRLRNVDTLGLSEDFALGPKGAIEVRFAQNLEAATQGFIEVLGNAAYTWRWGEDLLKVAGDVITRYQLNADGDTSTPWVNTRISGALINVSPPLWIGRLHTRAAMLLREDDLDHNATLFDSGLVRGYPATNLRGRNAFALNVEYRTRPINVLTMHLAGVLFYDAGTVFGAWLPGQESNQNFVYRHSVGVGLRALFPQFDRQSLRVDIGFPLTADLRGSVGTFLSLSFGAAFVGVTPPPGFAATGF